MRKNSPTLEQWKKLYDPDSEMVLGFETLSAVPSIKDMELSVPELLLRKLVEIEVKQKNCQYMKMESCMRSCISWDMNTYRCV
jgi:hypothetical protein